MNSGSRKIILSIITLTVLLMVALTNYVQAVTITKEKIKENLEFYTLKGKVATAVVGNNSHVIGGQDSKVRNLTITDDKILLTQSNFNYDIDYMIQGDVCVFSTESRITKESNDNEYLTEMSKPKLLAICFLGVTDSYGINSNDSLYYYDERVLKTSANVNYQGIDYNDSLGMAKRYIQRMGRYDGDIFKQYIKVLKNTENECEFRTVLEIKTSEIPNMRINKPVVQTNTNENQNQNKVENKVVNSEVTNSNEVNNTNTANEVSNNEIKNEVVNEVKNIVNEQSKENKKENKKDKTSAIFRGISIVIIIAIVVAVIVLMEKKK